AGPPDKAAVPDLQGPDRREGPGRGRGLTPPRRRGRWKASRPSASPVVTVRGVPDPRRARGPRLPQSARPSRRQTLPATNPSHRPKETTDARSEDDHDEDRAEPGPHLARSADPRARADERLVLHPGPRLRLLSVA